MNRFINPFADLVSRGPKWARLHAYYDVLAWSVRDLPDPIHEVGGFVSAWHMPSGHKRYFNYVAPSIPGAHRSNGCWWVPCSVLRMLDPARAETAWRSHPYRFVTKAGTPGEVEWVEIIPDVPKRTANSGPIPELAAQQTLKDASE